MSNDIIVFTLHKSASMFIHRQCELLSRLSGIHYNSPNKADSGLDARRLLTDRDIWCDRRGCFAPIRFFVDVPKLENYKVILHLRDPRDVLVSMFYSYCYIHGGEMPVNSGFRGKIAARGIDAFVLDKASESSFTYIGDYGTGGDVEDLIGNLYKRYRDYIEHLVGKPNVIFVKYEEMVTNYRRWLEKFIQPFPLDNKSGTIDKLVALSSQFFPKRTEDVMTHIRHVTPGDYKNKLSESTIKQLNEIFGDILETLDYS
jgi:hypothetical protein